MGNSPGLGRAQSGSRCRRCPDLDGGRFALVEGDLLGRAQSAAATARTGSEAGTHLSDHHAVGLNPRAAAAPDRIRRGEFTSRTCLNSGADPAAQRMLRSSIAAAAACAGGVQDYGMLSIQRYRLSLPCIDGSEVRGVNMASVMLPCDRLPSFLRGPLSALDLLVTAPSGKQIAT